MCRAELILVFQVEADQVVEDQAAQVAASLGKFHDARDETTRGTIPIFNLRRRQERDQYFKMVGLTSLGDVR